MKDQNCFQGENSLRRPGLLIWFVQEFGLHQNRQNSMEYGSKPTCFLLLYFWTAPFGKFDTQVVGMGYSFSQQLSNLEFCCHHCTVELIDLKT